MRTARIMVTTECDRRCSYCCNKPSNPAMHTCTLIDCLGEIPPVYDAYVVTGGEPFGNDVAVRKSCMCLGWVQRNRLKPAYLYTSVYHEGIPFQLLDGITYTLHYPMVPVDRDDFWKMQEHVTHYVTHRPNMRLTINKDIRVSRIPDINMGAWDEIRRIKFDPDGMCPLGKGEDLYLWR